MGLAVSVPDLVEVGPGVGMVPVVEMGVMPLRGLPAARGLQVLWAVAKWEAGVQYLPKLPAAMEPRL